MLNQIILFGAGNDGSEALNFFGAENVFAYVDNNPSSIGKQKNGKYILSFEQLKELFENNKLTAGILFEVVVTVTFDIWATHSVASQLKRIGIENFSIFSDIKKRWQSGEDFIKRDKEIYPCEQESMLKIYNLQFQYLLRHTDPSKLLPAQGELREHQLLSVKFASNFAKEMERLDIKLFLTAGSLLGAIRHKGYIPWDDDFDFSVTRDDYNRIIEYLLNNCGVYNMDRDNGIITKQNPDQFPDDSKSEYITLSNAGGINMALCIHKRKNNNTINDLRYSILFSSYAYCQPACFDILPLDYFPNTYTDLDYENDVNTWIEISKFFGRIETTKMWMKELENAKSHPIKSKRVGLSMDFVAELTRCYKAHNKVFTKHIFNTEDIYPLQKISFEDTDFWAPNNIDTVLKQMYGKDYMRLPPRVGVRAHVKSAFFDSIY